MRNAPPPRLSRALDGPITYFGTRGRPAPPPPAPPARAPTPDRSELFSAFAGKRNRPRRGGALRALRGLGGHRRGPRPPAARPAPAARTPRLKGGDAPGGTRL